MSRPILIVEPQHEVSLLLRADLAARGFATVLAGDGASARRATPAEPYRLILIESVLPDIDGVALGREFRRQPDLAEVPIVLLDSLNARRELTLETARSTCGASAFFRTPLSMGFFIEALSGLAGDAKRPVRAGILPTPILAESLPKMIRACYDFRKTGKLTVRSRGVERSIFFVEGSPRYVASSMVADHIGSILRREGLIQREHIDRILRKQRDTGKPFGQLAVEEGIVSRDTVRAYLLRQLVTVTGSLFALDEGETYFENAPGPPDAPSEAPIHPFHLIRMGIELGYDDAKLEKRLSPGDRFPVPVDTTTFQLRDLGLSDLELEFLEHVDGTLTIEELRRVPPLPESLNMQIIATLIYSRMVWLSDDAEAPSDVLRSQVKAYYDKEYFKEGFFKTTWDHADPGLVGPDQRVYQMLDITDPGMMQKLLERERTDIPRSERPRSSGPLWFGIVGVSVAFLFVLFLLSARPAIQILNSERLEESLTRPRERMVLPVFTRARRHYERGVELMTSQDPGDLEAAIEEFANALAIDRRFKEASEALAATQARLEALEGRQHYIEHPVEITGEIESPSSDEEAARTPDPSRTTDGLEPSTP